MPLTKEEVVRKLAAIESWENFAKSDSVKVRGTRAPLTRSEYEEALRWLQSNIDGIDRWCVFPSDKRFPARPFDVATRLLSNGEFSAALPARHFDIGSLNPAVDGLDEINGRISAKSHRKALDERNCLGLSSLLDERYRQASRDDEANARFGELARLAQKGIEESLSFFFCSNDGYDERDRILDFYNTMLDIAREWSKEKRGESDKFAHESMLLTKYNKTDVHMRQKRERKLMPLWFRDPFEAAVRFLLFLTGKRQDWPSCQTWEEVLESIRSWEQSSDFLAFVLGEAVDEHSADEDVEGSSESNIPKGHGASAGALRWGNWPRRQLENIAEALGDFDHYKVVEDLRLGICDAENGVARMHDLPPRAEGDVWRMRELSLEDYANLMKKASAILEGKEHEASSDDDFRTSSRLIRRRLLQCSEVIDAFLDCSKAIADCLELCSSLEKLTRDGIHKKDDADRASRESSLLEQSYRTYRRCIRTFSETHRDKLEHRLKRPDNGEKKFDRAELSLIAHLEPLLRKQEARLRRIIDEKRARDLAQRGLLQTICASPFDYWGPTLSARASLIDGCYRSDDPAGRLVYLLTCIFCIGSTLADWNGYCQLRFDDVAEASTGLTLAYSQRSKPGTFYYSRPTRNISVQDRDGNRYVSPVDLHLRSSKNGFVSDEDGDTGCTVALLCRWNEARNGDLRLRGASLFDTIPLAASKSFPSALYVEGEMRIELHGGQMVERDGEGSLRVPSPEFCRTEIVPSSQTALLRTLRCQALSTRKNKLPLKDTIDIAFPHVELTLPQGPRLAQSGGLCMIGLSDGVWRLWQISQRAIAIVETTGVKSFADHAVSSEVTEVTLALAAPSSEFGIVLDPGTGTHRIFAVGVSGIDAHGVALAESLFGVDGKELAALDTARKVTIRRGTEKWQTWARFREEAPFIQWR